MSGKRKFDLAMVSLIGSQLRELMVPCCERVEIVGSVRREKRLVGDLELLMVPKIQEEPGDLFGAEPTKRNLAREMIERFLAEGKIVKRMKSNGAVSSWGEQNLHAIHCRTGLPLDFFFASERSWISLMVCRTGPAALNVILAQRATEKGMHWNPYQGLVGSRGPRDESRGSTDESRGGGALIPTESEEEFFSLLGLPFKEPRLRAMLLPAWARK